MSDVAEKWGDAVASRGFAQIPNYLLLLNQFLDRELRLSPVELLVLLQLVGNWWRRGELPFPSMGTLAVRCGVSDRQIQRAINRLVELDLVKRVSRRTKGIIASNAYDLTPLVAFLGDVAKAFPNEFPRNPERMRRRPVNSPTALTDFQVVEQQPDIDGSVLIAANDGRQRVVAFVNRAALDDYGSKYFGRPHLSAEQRIFLLRSPNNLAAVAKTISAKYARGETTLYHGYGSTLPRVDIDLYDLELGPRLEVAPLLVFDGAGFKG
jgi:Helix-turn-helix domain